MKVLKLPIILFIISFGMLSYGKNKTNDSRYDPEDLFSNKISMPILPNFETNAWINGSPEVLSNLKGKVVMIDFWEYTSINFIRTIPYMKEWYKRYSDKGLMIIGVHTPEFSFGEERENIVNAVREMGILYPVVMDNDYIFWYIFRNHAWPAKYIFDKNGILRYISYGERNYGNVETMIQKLLQEKDPKVDLPEIMEPIRNADKEGAICYRITPVTYLGYSRGIIGNADGFIKDDTANYKQPNKVLPDNFYLHGKWDARYDSVKFSGSPGSGKLIMNYIAAEANLVIKPAGETNFKVYIYQDAKPVDIDDRGEDIKTESNGKTYILIDEARMYKITKNSNLKRHILTLEPGSDSFTAYVFSFVTVCKSRTDIALDELIKKT